MKILKYGLACVFSSQICLGQEQKAEKRGREDVQLQQQQEKKKKPVMLKPVPQPFVQEYEELFDNFDRISFKSDPKNVQDAYLLFELDPRSSWTDIENKHQSLILINHPNYNLNRLQEATANMQKVNAAYDILKKKREAYAYFGLEVCASLQDAQASLLHMLNGIKAQSQEQINQIDLDYKANLQQLKMIYPNLEKDRMLRMVKDVKAQAQNKIDQTELHFKEKMEQLKMAYHMISKME